jgi:hypothetical protein
LLLDAVHRKLTVIPVVHSESFVDGRFRLVALTTRPQFRLDGAVAKPDSRHSGAPEYSGLIRATDHCDIFFSRLSSG